MIVALTALVVALGGSAVAAVKLDSSEPLKVCVASREGGPIVTPKSGACKRGYTLTEVNKEGPEGKEGPQGKEGPVGSAVVDRIRLTSPFTVTAHEAPQEVTGLAGASWTQQAEETQGLVEATARLANPSSKACGARVALYLDGREVASNELGAPAGQSMTAKIRWNSEPNGFSEQGLLALKWLPEGLEPTTHTVRATARLGCSPNPEPVVLEQLHVAVIGVH